MSVILVTWQAHGRYLLLSSHSGCDGFREIDLPHQSLGDLIRCRGLTLEEAAPEEAGSHQVELGGQGPNDPIFHLALIGNVLNVNIGRFLPQVQVVRDLCRKYIWHP